MPPEQTPAARPQTPEAHHAWRRRLTALLAGGLQALCFAPGPLPAWSLPFVQIATLAVLAALTFQAAGPRRAAALGWLFGLGDASGFLALALNIFVGLEARNLLQATMRRRGWSDWGAVEASDAHEALMRYFAEAGHLDADSEAQPSLPMRYTGSGGPALGLFAYPDRR